MRPVRTLLVIAVAAALALPPAVAGAAPAADRTPVRGAIATVRIRMRDNVFRPRSVTIQRGTRVRWVNRGSNPHTTTSDGGLWDSGILESGESFSRRFRRVGTFRYHCEIHVGMTARIVVTA